jgi:hypothetical protein
MTARLTRIRDGVYEKVSNDIPGYVDTKAVVEKTYFPNHRLQDIGQDAFAHIKVVGKGFDQARIVRDATRTRLELPVELAVQRFVDPTDTDLIDDLIKLTEQVMASCADDELVAGANYGWLRTEALRDENNLPFSYEQLTREHIFQAIFTAYYAHVRE